VRSLPRSIEPSGRAWRFRGETARYPLRSPLSGGRGRGGAGRSRRAWTLTTPLARSRDRSPRRGQRWIDPRPGRTPGRVDAFPSSRASPGGWCDRSRSGVFRPAARATQPLDRRNPVCEHGSHRIAGRRAQGRTTGRARSGTGEARGPRERQISRLGGRPLGPRIEGFPANPS
jgi:hypothetical protein